MDNQLIDYYKEEISDILKNLEEVEKNRTETLIDVIRITSGTTFPELAPNREAMLRQFNEKYDMQVYYSRKRLKELREAIACEYRKKSNKRRRTQLSSKSKSDTKMKDTEHTILKKGAEWVDDDGVIHLTDTEDEDENEEAENQNQKQKT